MLMGALLVIAVPAAGCGELSSTGPPPVSDAVSQVKEDGFSVDVTSAGRNNCAAAGLYSAQHGNPPVQADPNLVTTPFPHTMFSPISITYSPDRPGTRPEIDTYLASGRLLLLGLSQGQRQAALTERDLHELAGEIGW